MSALDNVPDHAWRGRVQSVERALALLDAIAAGPPRGSTVAELALACGINRATAWRLLATLEGRGLVDRDPATSRYQIGYTVARLKAPGSRDLITITGRFPDIHAGQTLRLTGYWRDHPKYGQQFQVVHAQETKPATLTGLEKYLGSGLIKGIGPVTAKRIVAHFGLETLEIIEQSCSRLVEVPGIAIEGDTNPLDQRRPYRQAPSGTVTRNLYVTAMEPQSGKSVVALGLMELL